MDRDTFPPHAKFPNLSFEHEWVEYPYTNDNDTEKRIAYADIVIVNKVNLGSYNLKHAKRLKLIALTATGSNNIDLDYCKANNITVANIQNYSTQSVVEHCLSLIFALNRNIIAYNKMLVKGEWQKSRHFALFAKPIADLRGATLGIVGRGNLGRTLGAYCSGLGMKVIFAERPQATKIRLGYQDFYEVLKTSDIVSLHCPLTELNEQMMGEKEFDAMKKSAIFINTARGALVDEQALAEALCDGKIMAAGLDVLSIEPPDADNPLLALVDMPNLIITPHSAWTSNESLESGIQQTIENIEAYIAQKPIRVISV